MLLLVEVLEAGAKALAEATRAAVNKNFVMVIAVVAQEETSSAKEGLQGIGNQARCRHGDEDTLLAHLAAKDLPSTWHVTVVGFLREQSKESARLRFKKSSNCYCRDNTTVLLSLLPASR